MPKYDEKYKLNDERYVRKGAEVNIVLVGDTNVGKTALCINYIHNKFAEDTRMSTFLSVKDIYHGVKNVYQAKLSVNIQDTPGDDPLFMQPLIRR